MRVGAVIQARTGSSRLPQKALAQIGKRPMLAHVIERVHLIRGLDCKPIVATSTRAEDGIIGSIASVFNCYVYRGAELDVLARILAAADEHKLDAVLRVTADCPVLDPVLNSMLVAEYRAKPCDYYGPGDWPAGLVQEIISVEALRLSDRLATDPADREHVITWAVNNPTHCTMRELDVIDMSVDTQADLDRIRTLV